MKNRILGGAIGSAALFLQGRSPGQLVVQYTDRCNAACPQCGMRAKEGFARSTLSVDEVKRMIDAAAARNVKCFSITGGEPMIYREEVTKLLGYARKAGIPFTRTGTNGFLFMNHTRPGFEKRVGELARELLEAGVYTFWISLDSAVPSVHEQMRGLPGVWEGIRKAIPVFRKEGLYPAANLGINRNTGGMPVQAETDEELSGQFRVAFARFYSSVIDLGFTITNACYPMSEGPRDAVYRATGSGDIVNFTPGERRAVYRALFDTVKEYRDRIRIFTPLSSLYALINREVETEVEYPCRGGIDYFFVSASDGDAYPCGYRAAENLGKFWDLQPSRDDEKACARCDWECFRDPSELLGPFMQVSRHPLKVAGRWMKDKVLFRIWLDDLRYYYACDFFCAHVAADHRKLSGFGARRDMR
jgi:MoaA/NifB/PqqE/SkfB family radical SAM enzyme